MRVYDQLKDRYPLTMTNTFALNEGFTIDCPILVGQAHGQIISLYEYHGDFVMDVMDAEKTMGTHWHPINVSEAVDHITEFMEGQSDYIMQPFNLTPPIDIILDTDAGGDCDDMLALAYLVYAQRAQKARIRAVTQCNACPGGPDMIRTFFEFLNEPVPPIGGPVGNAKNCDGYCSLVLDRFGDGKIRSYPDAVAVLRRALAESENAVLCAIGPMNNIAALLKSPPDAISPLDGVSLVHEKCAKVVLMAGGFVCGKDGRPVPEWNALVDVPATKTVVELCPAPIVFLPFETGLDMLTGGPLMEKFDESTPLTLSYIRYPYDSVRKNGGRHSWDPATLLYAVEGCGDRFDESPRGTVEIDDEGRTLFHADEDGLHSCLTIRPHAGLSEAECKKRIAGYLDRCAMDAHSAIK